MSAAVSPASVSTAPALAATAIVIGHFATEAGFVAAAKAAKDAGLRGEYYLPWPVHGIEAALGLERSLIGRPVLGAIAFGCAAAFAMQYGLQVVDWPVIYSGKPYFTWQLWVVVTLETGLLLGAVTNLLACFHVCRLYPNPSPAILSPRHSDDRFGIALPVGQDRDEESLLSWLRAHGADAVEVQRPKPSAAAAAMGEEHAHA
jgi:hypothetical protein